MKTVRIEGDGWDKESAVTVRPIKVPGVGECVLLEGKTFAVILQPEQAKDIAVTMLRMVR